MLNMSTTGGPHCPDEETTQRALSEDSDVQADLSLYWEHRSCCRFCYAPAQYHVNMFAL